MKRILYIICAAGILFSCNNTTNKKDQDTKDAVGKAVAQTENRIKLSGKWKGIVPAADCSGIEYDLELNNGETYKLKITYIDGEGDGIDMVFKSEGDVANTVKEGKTFLNLLPPPGNDTVNLLVVDKKTLRLVNKDLEEPSGEANYNLKKEKQ